MPLAMLDTSSCIDILRGHPLPEDWRHYQFCISSIVETELWAGVFHSGGETERIKVEKLLASVEVLPFDGKAARASGEILGILAKAGKTIGDFDCQIAGQAVSLRAPLATKNRRHFNRIESLRLLEYP